jgi:hypothetical protein
MTDPTIGVGEAAPRAPRLDDRLRAAVTELCVAVRGSGDMPYSWFPAIAKLLALEDEGALAAARSALPPPQTPEDKEDARVAPFNPRVAPTGSTAKPSPGNATAAERTEPETIVAAYEKAADEWCAQCFCFTSAPETLRRAAHEAAREGFGAIRDILGPLARPILDAEYKAAEQQAKAAALPRAPEPRPGYEQRIELGLRLGQILGPEYDGVSIEEIARELVVLKLQVRAARAGAEAPSQLIAGLRAFAADLARYQDTYADECALITQAADALEGK